MITEQDVPLREFLEELRSKSGIPGFSVTVSVAGKRRSAAVGVAAAGEATALTPQSRFQLGCVTKLLTSLVVLQLVHDGVLHLEAPLGEYLTELDDLPRAREIQLRHLASHSSGYQGLSIANPQVAYLYSWEKFSAFLRNTPQMFAPGAVFNYEHSECVLLGAVIQRVTGVATREWIRQRIFDPLGLRPGTLKGDTEAAADHAIDAATGQYRRIRSVPYAQFWADSLSDLTLSTWDLATFANALAQADACKLDPHAIRQCRRQLVHLPRTIGGNRSEQAPLSFGFGCAEYAGGLLGHNGSGRGQTCSLRFDPDRDAAIVVALTAWQPHLRDWLVNRLAAEFLPAPTPAAAASFDGSWDAADLEGTYTSCVQGTSAVVRRNADSLTCTINNATANTRLSLTLVQDDTDSWRMQSDAGHLAVGFFRDPQSDARCMMLGLNAFKRISMAN
jgi:CubicO group peptidase (beta-lactamase class C family)